MVKPINLYVMSKNKKNYKMGESFVNPYLGNKIIEVLDRTGRRIGWLWQTIDKKIIVSPHLGVYIWYAEGGREWDESSGANWLLRNQPKKRKA